jgi:hypothetical protein
MRPWSSVTASPRSAGNGPSKWAVERRDLNNRIQVPEAAPFLFEAKPEDGEDDLPLPPEFVADAEELEKARAALAEVGYEEGGTGL